MVALFLPLLFHHITFKNVSEGHKFQDVFTSALATLPEWLQTGSTTTNEKQLRTMPAFAQQYQKKTNTHAPFFAQPIN